MRFFLVLSLSSQLLAAQSPGQMPASNDRIRSDNQVVYEMHNLQEPPAFPGGEQGLLKFLSENVSYPSRDPAQQLIATMVFAFVVEADGSISNIEALRPVHPPGQPFPIQQACMNVLEAMPRWKPGEVNGQPVAARFMLPVRIHLK